MKEPATRDEELSEDVRYYAEYLDNRYGRVHNAKVVLDRMYAKHGGIRFELELIRFKEASREKRN